MNINQTDVISHFNSLNPTKSLGLDTKRSPTNLKKERVLRETIDKAAYWASTFSFHKKYTESELRHLCKEYLYAKINYKKLYMPSGFIEPFTWSTIVAFIVKWVVEQLIKYIMEKLKESIDE